MSKYAKANNEYTKSYEESIESLYLMYLDVNNLYGWTMSQKRPVNGFKWVKKLSERNSIESDERFLNNYDENNEKGYFLEVDVEYPKSLFSLHGNFPFLPERKKIEKFNKFVCTFYDKENYVVHIKALN